MFSCYEEGASLFYCINNVGLMWGEGPSGPVLGQGWGGVPPAQRSSPLINLVGGGAPCPSTTAKCYTLYGWDGSALA